MKKLRKFLEEIGPLLAGFQIAASIIGFFGIGVVAKWILENWLPFTRWAWTEFFSFIHLPEITTADKDALTTLAFFAPMAISSLWSYWDKENSEPVEIEEDSFGKETRLRLYATAIGITFMVVIGGSVIQDTVTLFTTEAPEAAKEISTSILDVEFFANLGLAVVVILLIAGLTLLYFYVYSKNKKLSSKTDSFVDWFTRKTKPINKQVTSRAAFHVTTMAVQVISTLISFGGMSAGIIFAAGQLGFIRTAAPILVLASFLITIFLNPGRLLKTAGVVIALMVASLGWDAAIWVVHAVENAPVT